MDSHVLHPHETLCYETEDDRTVEWVLKHSVHEVTFIKMPKMFEIKSELRREKTKDKNLEKYVLQFL